jgi:nucleobase:cation symporter-1, NCS1 family
MMVDYFWVKRGHVDVDQLFSAREDGPYYYRRGVNPKALWAFVPTAALSALCALAPALDDVAAYSWFIGAATSAVLYGVLCRDEREPAPAPAALAGTEG